MLPKKKVQKNLWVFPALLFFFREKRGGCCGKVDPEAEFFQVNKGDLRLKEKVADLFQLFYIFGNIQPQMVRSQI